MKHTFPGFYLRGGKLSSLVCLAVLILFTGAGNFSTVWYDLWISKILTLLGMFGSLNEINVLR